MSSTFQSAWPWILLLLTIITVKHGYYLDDVVPCKADELSFKCTLVVPFLFSLWPCKSFLFSCWKMFKDRLRSRQQFKIYGTRCKLKDLYHNGTDGIWGRVSDLTVSFTKFFQEDCFTKFASVLFSNSHNFYLTSWCVTFTLL